VQTSQCDNWPSLEKHTDCHCTNTDGQYVSTKCHMCKHCLPLTHSDPELEQANR